MTSRRVAPRRTQKTKGPAKSVSCITEASGCLRGFKTDKVCVARGSVKRQVNEDDFMQTIMKILWDKFLKC